MRADDSTWQNCQQKLIQAINSRQLQIIVPTMNSQAYIDIILGHYQRLGLDVCVAIDAKTSDATQSIVQRSHTDVRVVENPKSVVEGMIEQLSLDSGAQWVLRLDDDELPSMAMLAYVADILSRPDVHAVGFVRKQCVVTTDGKLKQSLVHRETDHRQWRLYRPDQMRYTDAVHTAGFHPVPEHSDHAPPEAHMIHLDWSLHDHASRQEKVNRYDRHTPGKGSQWRSFYLYEDDPDHGPDKFEWLDAPEFDAVCTDISTRFPNNCLKPRGWLSRWFGRHR